jgi:hypothetical protein
MPAGDDIRDVQRAAWAGLSAGWEKWDPVIMDQLGPVSAAMIECLHVASDQQHLAAGTGEPGLTVARLARRGHVVLTDLAAEMLAIAARRADARGIGAVLAQPGPDGPGMFRCAAPGYVSVLYRAAGLREVAEWDVGVELVTDSPVQYWEMISEHVSLAVAALKQVGEPTRERIAEAVIARASTYEDDGTVRIPGVARCIIGTK